jgi:acetyl-CoA carboxylase biotin carboxyl carrier protein
MAESAEFMQQVFKETKELIRSMEGTATSKVRIAVSGIEIEVKRDGEAFTTTAVPMSSSMSAGGGTATPPANAGGMPVVAPLVGVFYRSSSPGSKPFVEVGDTVERGQTIGIVEAMKVMNEVQSDYRGVVAEILVENGEAVQYEQRLMLINVG